ncbi:uncharacterized protein LOC117802654 isoform X3 [Ailuropoda melanoleuca]|uniref:uncharacterized protein LOC117802654 isoform X3 n=1 Tax=Ailuropoda melanoleuca TaxID=9646 RepID=UPI001494DBBF|nr:uncharacterized protein LOC117802654 isoform X3 [Ailuropoda melanoleuca]
MPGPAPLPGEGAACGGWRPPRRRLSDRPRGPRGPRGPPAADPGLLCGRARGGRLRPSRPRGTRARAATGLRRRAACLVPTRGPKLRIPGPPPTSRSGPGAAKQATHEVRVVSGLAAASSLSAWLITTTGYLELLGSCLSGQKRPGKKRSRRIPCLVPGW